MVIKYFCDICSVELGTLPENELNIHTSSDRDITLHLCTKCIDNPITNLMTTLRAQRRIRLAERETIMHVTIKGSVIKE